jgi:hypothetical protein
LYPDDFFAVKDRIIKESRFRIAFLYCTPLLLLDNIGYSSNIFSYSENIVPDWTGDLGVGLRTSAILADRLILQAGDIPHYSFYLENKELRSWSNEFQATAYSYVGPLNFKADFVQSDLTQRPYQEFSRPFRYGKQVWSGEVDLGRRTNMFLTAYVRFSKLAYEEDPYLGSFYLADSLNRRENSFGLTLNRRIFTRTVIYLNYEFNDFAFAATAERDSVSHAVGIGVELPEIGPLQGGFQIGYMRIDPRNPAYSTSQNLNGSGNVRVTLFDRLRFNLFYSLGTSFSYSASDLYFNSHAYGGGVDFYLTSHMKIGATYQEGRLNFHSFLDPGYARRDRTSTQRYFLAFPLFGDASFGLAYTVYRLRSEELNLDITRSYWGGFVSYDF